MPLHVDLMCCQGVRGFLNQEPSFRTEWGDAPVFVILGLLGVAIPQTLVYVGNKVPTAVNSFNWMSEPLPSPKPERMHACK